MGTNYSGYYSEPTYNYVGGPVAEVTLPGQPMDHTLFTENAMPWDRLLTGGYMSFIYFLWLLVCPVILGVLQFMYVLQWSIQITMILVFVELGILLIGLIWSAIWAARGDFDIRRIAYAPSNEASLLALLHAKRSRNNNATDLALMVSGFVIAIIELTIVLLYIYGGPNNHWLNGHTGTVNYPITKVSAFPTLTAAAVQQVFFRALIHFFGLAKGLGLISLLFWTRINAVAINDNRQRTFAKLHKKNEINAPATAEDAYHLGAMNTRATGANQ